MDLKQLKYFKAVADGGSICEGARKLSISQPPLSYQMKMLEDELGVKLFDRGSRNISLTDAGRILYERATGMLQMADGTIHEMEGIRNHPVLRIGMTPTSGPRITALIHQFLTQYPGTRFEVYEGNTFTLLELLEQRTIDITTIRTPISRGHINTISMGTDPMIIAGSSSFLKAASRTVSMTLEAMVTYPLIIYRRYHDLILETIKSAGLQQTIICNCDDARTAMLWAKSSLGIAIFPESMRMYCHGLEIRTLDCDELKTEILLAWRSDRIMPGIVSQFRQFVQDREKNRFTEE